MNKLPCPEPEALSDFAFGRLDEDDLERIAVHLEECSQCLSAVRTLDGASDTLLSQLQSGSVADSADVSEVCRRAMECAAKLLDEPADATVAARLVPKLGRIRDYELIEALGRGGIAISSRRT